MKFTDVSEQITQVAKNLKDSNRVRKAGIMAAEAIRKHIYTGDFKALSAATEAYRGAGKPLQDTASLRDSITSNLITADTVSVGTNKKYAPVHNNGATITAKKNWLFIPAGGTRKLERRYGKNPGDVLSGLRKENFWVYRVGRTVCYRKKSKKSAAHVVYYLKKSVVIPKREFFYITDDELSQIVKEVSNDIF